MLMIGTGALSTNLIKAYASIRPIKKVFVWGRNFEKAQAISTALKNESFSIQPIKTIEEKIENDELVNCSEDEKTEIQSAIGNLREILSDNNQSSTSIKESFEKLQNLLEGKLN